MTARHGRTGGPMAASRRRVVCFLAALAAGTSAAAQDGDPDLYCAIIAAATEQAEVRAINRLAASWAAQTGEDIESAQSRVTIVQINRDMAQRQRDAIEAKLNEARYKPVDTSQQEATLALAREERNARANGVRLLLEQRRALEALELQRRGGGVSDADLQAARDAVAGQERSLASGKPLNVLDAAVAEAEWALGAALAARRAEVDILQIDLAAADRDLALKQQAILQATAELSAAYGRDATARKVMWEVAACAQARANQLAAAAKPPMPAPVYPLAQPPSPRPPAYVPASPPPAYVPAAPPPAVVAAPPVVVVPGGPPPRYVPPPDYRRPAHVVAPNRGPGYGPPQRHSGPSTHPPPRRPPGDRSQTGAHVKPTPSGSTTHVKPAPTGSSMNKPMTQTPSGTPPRGR